MDLRRTSARDMIRRIKRECGFGDDSAIPSNELDSGSAGEGSQKDSKNRETPKPSKAQQGIYGFGLAFCHFAIHFFIDSDDFIRLMKNIMRNGSRILCTFMDASKIRPDGELVRVDGKTEFHIKPMPSTFTQWNVFIRSIPGGWRAERKVTLPYLQSRLQMAGFSLESVFPFSHMGHIFPMLENRLTAETAFLSSFYSCATFTKNDHERLQPRGVPLFALPSRVWKANVIPCLHPKETRNLLVTCKTSFLLLADSCPARAQDNEPKRFGGRLFSWKDHHRGYSCISDLSDYSDCCPSDY